ncbi:hypothetical protein [Gordonia hirsuta]|nr:hypothetical protein [Gordonia hirsuta]
MGNRNDLLEPAASAPELSHATSTCGGLAVTTTADGLPVGLRIAQTQLSVSLEVVAERIVALCALAAAGSGYRRREQLAAAGTATQVLDALGLPDRSALLRIEENAETWCRTSVPRARTAGHGLGS